MQYAFQIICVISQMCSPNIFFFLICFGSNIHYIETVFKVTGVESNTFRCTIFEFYFFFNSKTCFSPIDSK